MRMRMSELALVSVLPYEYVLIHAGCLVLVFDLIHVKWCSLRRPLAPRCFDREIRCTGVTRRCRLHVRA
jgi:hypothetical protein